MPNQRKKGKTFIGGYISGKLAAEFKAIADERRLSVKDLLEELIKKDLNKELNKEPNNGR